MGRKSIMIHPLDGIKIVDVSQAWSGPYATMMLGDLGANVIKVEPPGNGDHSRLWSPAPCNGESPHFLCANRNKRSIAINLKNHAGVELFLKLVEKSDILVENFKPGVMKKLGIGYETVKEKNPQIIYCSVSGFGQTGPLSDWPAYDLIIQAIGGAIGVTGEGERYAKPGIPQADIIGAIVTAFSIMGSLLYRDRTGQGCYLDISMLDTQVSTMGFHIINYLLAGQIARPMGTAHPLLAPYEAFETSTQQIVIGVGNEKHWRKFCDVIQAPHLAEDPRFCDSGRRVNNRDELIPLIKKIIKKRSADYWIAHFSENDVPSGPINDVVSLSRNAQILHRNMLIDVDNHKLGKIKIPGIPWKIPGLVEKIKPPPRLGEHTEEILSEMGLSSDDIQRLRVDGSIEINHNGCATKMRRKGIS